MTVSFTYNASGNQQTVSDALGHTTTTLYDALDRATTIISAVSGTTTITYDAAGRETSLTDPDGNETQRAYDADDRMTTQTQPNGHTVTNVYNYDGELTDTTDEDGRRTTYSYDADGDQTGETWVGASPAEKITYTYDADNEMTGAADAVATLTFTYNADGELATDATSGPGSGQPAVTLTYGYDQVGDETSVTDSLGSQGITTNSYDAANQLTTITTSYGGTAGPQVAYDYDDAGRLTSISRQIGSGTAVEINTAIGYDTDNRVVTMTDSSATYSMFPPGWSISALATYVYRYDDASRVTSETDAEGTYSYTYDNANELTGVTEGGTPVGTYSYDSNGNRTGTGYTTTTDNEQTASPGYTYTYDNAGNMISATNTSTSLTTTYTYDFRNRLSEVTTGGTVVATYTYNALSQRIGVKDSGTQTWTVYNGTSPDANPYADFNGSGSLTERYLFGPGVVNGAVVDEILARTTSGGTTAWYLTDKLGSVRDIVSTSGSELDHIVYDSFGNIVTETNAANGDRFKFAGMQYDGTVGLYFDHARSYSALAGRFIKEDPIQFDAGDANLYRYVDNSPERATDPSGEFWLQVGATVGGMVIGGTVAWLSNGDPIQIFAATLGGGCNGLLGSLGVPPVVAGAASGCLTSLVTQGLSGNFSGQDLLLSTLLSAATSGVAGAVFGNVKGTIPLPANATKVVSDKALFADMGAIPVAGGLMDAFLALVQTDVGQGIQNSGKIMGKLLRGTDPVQTPVNTGPSSPAPTGNQAQLPAPAESTSFFDAILDTGIQMIHQADAALQNIGAPALT